jgi:hypothetical protein
LSFYMGKNTPDRQNFIIDNLKVDIDSAWLMKILIKKIF